MSALDYLGIALVTLVCLMTVILIRVRREPAEAVEPSVIRDLNEHRTRENLERFLNNLRIIGDANIRDGRVCEVVPSATLDQCVRQLRLKLNALRRRIDVGQMRGTDLYYTYDLGTHNEYGMADIQIENIEALVGVGERVVEDRRRSRSLYKGHTEEELIAIVRVGMERYWRDADGDFWEEADAALQGRMDNTREAEVALHVLRQLFEIKGAAE